MNDGAAQPSWRLSEVLADDRRGLESIAELHMELLDDGPMAGLGRDFVREVCYRAHMVEGVLRVLLAEVDGQPAGFVAVTPYSLSFHRSGLRAHGALAAWETLKAMLASPGRLRRLARALRVLSSRRGELHRATDALGEVVCIAVRPQYLTARFVRAAGGRLSEELVKRSAEYLRRGGIDQMRMLVDADNRAVLMLYHLLGAQFNAYRLGGAPMVEVVFDLRDGRLAAAPPVPPSWTPSGRASSAGGDWSAYWEEVTERPQVFRAEARDYIARLRRLVKVDGTGRVLDFGCGFGFAAEQLAPHVGSLALWDGSAHVRRRARVRVAHVPNIELVDLSNPERWVPEGEFDLITVHSVVQYMPEAEIARWIERWRRMLAPGGRLVLSDLIQPGTGALRELLGYLHFSARAGFFGGAVVQGLRGIGQYWHARRTRPLTLVPPERLEHWVRTAGFSVEGLPENLSYRRSRRAAVLQSTC